MSRNLKLAISTLGCPNWSFAQILENFSSYPVQGIEVRGIDGVMDADKMPLLTPERLPELHELLRSHRLPIIGFGTSFSFHDADRLPQTLSDARRTIDILSRAGIPAMRVFGNSIPDPTRRDQTIRQVADALCQLADYAQPRNVQVNLEVHGDFNSTETLKPIVEAIADRHPAAGILWDIEHSDKVCGDDFMPFYSLIRPVLRHIHVKDYLRNREPDAKDWTLVKCGDGDIPIRDILTRVLDDGYDGFLSFEWEKKWHPDIDEPEVAFPHFVAKMHEWLD